jgi:poly(3-hydroxybutyrate) depolymerase
VKTFSIAMLLLIVVFLPACASAAIDKGGRSGFIQKTNSSGRDYVLFVPHNLDPNKKYPMIVFLHGMGEGGTDFKAPTRVGLGPYIDRNKATFDFFVLFPQSSTGYWNDESGAVGDVLDMINKTCATYPVDRDRVSLTGLSTGGYGTFSIGAKFPSTFAALVPLCASQDDVKDAATLARMNIWSFENAGDPFGGGFATQRTIGAIRAAGGKPQSTVYPLPGHDCWSITYEQGDLFKWLRETKRKPL